MNRITHALSNALGLVATAALLTACAEEAPVAPAAQSTIETKVAAADATIEQAQAVATLQRVTARYHDLNVALQDTFVLLHECEVRPGEGPVGMVYVNFNRLLDGVIDPSSPDALVYEPAGPSGRPALVAAEFAMPYALWTDTEPPKFLGAEFQREDEFGVYGLHVWIWRQNPNGLFEEANPRISCGEA